MSRGRRGGGVIADGHGRDKNRSPTVAARRRETRSRRRAARASRVRRRAGVGGAATADQWRVALRPTGPVPSPRTARPRERARLSNKRATCARHRRHTSPPSPRDLAVTPPGLLSSAHPPRHLPSGPSTAGTGFRVNSINVLFKTLNAPESPRSAPGGRGARTVGES